MQEFMVYKGGCLLPSSTPSFGRSGFWHAGLSDLMMRGLCMFLPSFVSALSQTNMEAQNEPSARFHMGQYC